MSIIVTGTAGFIGFHVAKALLDKGYAVEGIDNFNPYYNVQLKHDRDRVLQDYSHYKSWEMDLCDTEGLHNLFEQAKPDVVCHLAAQAGVRYSLTHPFVYEKSNEEGFLSILEACRHAVPMPRLVYASSSSVYGGNRKLPFNEEDSVDHPVSLYAATKKSNELMAHVYTHLYQLQTIGLRFFTVYGPWGRPDMAMWLFTEAMLQNKPIDVFNYGDMRRDFTFIDDVTRGVLASLFADHLDSYEIFNLGNNRSENLMDMIHCIAQELQVEPTLNMCPMQPGDVAETYADIERARTKLGYHPVTPISDGIPAFVSWYKQYHNIC